jgi:hypothetical protein
MSNNCYTRPLCPPSPLLVVASARRLCSSSPLLVVASTRRRLGTRCSPHPSFPRLVVPSARRPLRLQTNSRMYLQTSALVIISNAKTPRNCPPSPSSSSVLRCFFTAYDIVVLRSSDRYAEIAKYWVDCTQAETDSLYEHEWTKHGTCVAAMTGFSQNEYFEKALELYYENTNGGCYDLNFEPFDC